MEQKMENEMETLGPFVLGDDGLRHVGKLRGPSIIWGECR